MGADTDESKMFNIHNLGPWFSNWVSFNYSTLTCKPATWKQIKQQIQKQSQWRSSTYSKYLCPERDWLRGWFRFYMTSNRTCNSPSSNVIVSHITFLFMVTHYVMMLAVITLYSTVRYLCFRTTGNQFPNDNTTSFHFLIETTGPSRVCSGVQVCRNDNVPCILTLSSVSCVTKQFTRIGAKKPIQLMLLSDQVANGRHECREPDFCLFISGQSCVWTLYYSCSFPGSGLLDNGHIITTSPLANKAWRKPLRLSCLFFAWDKMTTTEATQKKAALKYEAFGR